MNLTYEQRRALESQRAAAAWNAKAKLNAAFRLLRRENIICKQRFMCCGTCAGAQIAADITESIDAGKKRPDGVVFYTKQSGFFDGDPVRAKVTKLYLQYGDVETTKHGVVGIGTVEVGKRICKALDAVGLAYEWDGSENSTIVVDPCPGLWGKTPKTALERITAPSVFDIQ